MNTEISPTLIVNDLSASQLVNQYDINCVDTVISAMCINDIMDYPISSPTRIESTMDDMYHRIKAYCLAA